MWAINSCPIMHGFTALFFIFTARDKAVVEVEPLGAQIWVENSTKRKISVKPKYASVDTLLKGIWEASQMQKVNGFKLFKMYI